MNLFRCGLDFDGSCRGIIKGRMFKRLRNGSVLFDLGLRVWPGGVRIRRRAGAYGSRRRRGRGMSRGSAFRILGHHGDRFVLERSVQTSLSLNAHPARGLAPDAPFNFVSLAQPAFAMVLGC